MIDANNIRDLLQGENFKEIEDVIDARKRLGQYNVYKHPNPFNIRCAYSSFQKPQEITLNRTVKFEETTPDKDLSGVRHTDSEITIVRIKCTGTVFKRKFNKWDMMDDIAIPGDGTHLGESPSMVNLATLVTQNVQCEGDDEYLVPLSSWDPFVKSEDAHSDILKSASDSQLNEKYSVRCSYTDPNIPCRLENSSGSVQTDPELEEVVYQTRRNSWAGKFSQFWRKHWRKVKSSNEPETTEQDTDKPDDDNPNVITVTSVTTVNSDSDNDN